MSSETKRLFIVASKICILLSLIAIAVYIIASVAFYIKGYDQFMTLQTSIFSRPIVYLIPFLLILGFAGTMIFKDADQLRPTTRRLRRYRPLIGAVAGICLIAIAVYFYNYEELVKEEYLSATNSKSNRAPIDEEEKGNSLDNNTLTQVVEKEFVEDSAIIPPQKANKTKSEKTSTASSGVHEYPSVELKYKVISRAYFHSSPNKATRRNAYINKNSSYKTLYPKGEANGFVYVLFTDNRGQTVEGWLNKKDLRPINELTYNTGK